MLSFNILCRQVNSKSLPRLPKFLMTSAITEYQKSELTHSAMWIMAII